MELMLQKASRLKASRLKARRLKARRLKPLQKASSLWLRLQLHHRVCCCRHRHRQCILQRRQRNFRQRRRRLQMIMEGRQYHVQEMTGTGGPSGSTTAKQLATCLKQRLRRGKRRQPPSRCRSSRRSPRRKMTRVGPRRPRPARTPDDKKAWGGGQKAEWKNHAAAASKASSSSSSSSWRGSQWDNDWTLARSQDPPPWEKSLNCNYFSVYSQESHVFDFVFGDVL